MSLSGDEEEEDVEPIAPSVFSYGSGSGLIFKINPYGVTFDFYGVLL
jgi:hypothetical protein